LGLRAKENDVQYIVTSQDLFVAIEDADYPETYHILMTKTFEPDEPKELVMQEITALWNRGFYKYEAEIVARHLNAAFDELGTLHTGSMGRLTQPQCAVYRCIHCNKPARDNSEVE
jgi:hypothetical protein